MQKLTKKEFVEALKNSNKYFLHAIYDHTLEEVDKAIKDNGIDKLIQYPIYQWNTMKEKSTKLAFYKEDRTISYRDFFGNNEYYKNDIGILYHINRQGETTTIMINY
jgi:hypothetical protein